ncbi:unnamed protein product [Adineta steineri]|uniref:Uncharacterized protein n=1 Tax=Adineta steineri TaxID=433720 RepID=A0A819GRL3_9BILA|nr:unnamed protein product [Adineta steineri]CAF3885806.1 unnamed protein product [Adineta steineri]
MTTVLNKPYSSFTDPNLKEYFDNKQRLKQLRKFGLLNKKNEVYPETVYQANNIQADRQYAMARMKFQREAQEELHKQHIRLHKKWDEQAKQQRRKWDQSRNDPASKFIPPVYRFPDVTQLTEKHFSEHGFDYYPDYCRPQTSYTNQWHRLGRHHSPRRPATSDIGSNQRSSTTSSNEKKSSKQLSTASFEKREKSVFSPISTTSNQHAAAPVGSILNIPDTSTLTEIVSTPPTTLVTSTNESALLVFPNICSPTLFTRIQTSERDYNNRMLIFKNPTPLDLLDNEF